MFSTNFLLKWVFLLKKAKIQVKQEEMKARLKNCIRGSWDEGIEDCTGCWGGDLNHKCAAKEG